MHYVITGSSTGMGANLVAQLREQGHRVTGLDIAEPTIEVDHYLRLDLSDPASIAEAAAQIDSLDALVNCAGIPGDVAPADVVFAVNYLGLRALTDALLPKIVDGGSILSIASMAGHRWKERGELYRELLAQSSFEAGMAWYMQTDAAQEKPVYAVSKEAVWAYTSVLATRLFERRIRVNSICPGLVETRIMNNFIAKMSDEAVQSMNAMTGGPIQPSDIAAVMRLLLSADAHWINGQNIVVDGGYLVGAEYSSWEL